MRASARRVRNVRVNAGAASLFQYAEPSDQTMRKGIPLRAPISASRRASGPVAGGAAVAVASDGAVSFMGYAPEDAGAQSRRVDGRSSCAASKGGSSHGGRDGRRDIEGALKYHVPRLPVLQPYPAPVAGIKWTELPAADRGPTRREERQVPPWRMRC